MSWHVYMTSSMFIHILTQRERGEGGRKRSREREGYILHNFQAIQLPFYVLCVLQMRNRIIDFSAAELVARADVLDNYHVKFARATLH